MYNYCIIRVYETLNHILGMRPLQSCSLNELLQVPKVTILCFTRPRPEEALLYSWRNSYSLESLFMRKYCPCLLSVALQETAALLWAKHMSLLIPALFDLNNAREKTYALKHTESLHEFRHTESFLINNTE